MSEYQIRVCDFCERQLRAGEPTTEIAAHRTFMGARVWCSDDARKIDVCDPCAASVTMADLRKRFYEINPVGPEATEDEDAAE